MLYGRPGPLLNDPLAHHLVPFRVFEHTADIGIEVEAPDLAGLLAESARALFEVVRGENPVAAKETRTVEVEADRLDRLVVAFLEEFVFLQDAEGLVFRDVHDVAVDTRPDGWSARATVTGESFSHTLHPGCLHVKAITRHDLQVTPASDGTPARARLILDI